uniref:Secreted protein n=1 Tax=Arundo donax TaxID=35708 RepID=A0A0A9GSC7_ARUDO
MACYLTALLLSLFLHRPSPLCPSLVFMLTSDLHQGVDCCPFRFVCIHFFLYYCSRRLDWLCSGREAA